MEHGRNMVVWAVLLSHTCKSQTIISQHSLH